MWLIRKRKGIFVSYRREDSSGWAGRLATRLMRAFGPRRVFFDLASLDPGVSYAEAIDKRLDASAVLLVVIGPDWLTAAGKDGQPRLHDPRDLTRREVLGGLARGIPVIPVLVGKAGMPSEDQLPDELKPLAGRNAFDLSDSRWNYDEDQLIARLKHLLGVRAWLLSASLTLAACAIGIAVWWSYQPKPAPEPEPEPEIISAQKRRPAIAGAKTPVEQALSLADLRRIQQAICAPLTDSFDDLTREYIRIYQKASNHPAADGMIGSMSAQELINVAPCNAAFFKNYYEASRFRQPEAVKELQSMLNAKDPSRPIPLTGLLDAATRNKIVTLRAILNLRAPGGEHFKDQITEDLVYALR